MKVKVEVRLRRDRQTETGSIVDADGCVVYYIDGSPRSPDWAWFSMRRFFGDVEDVPESLTVEWDDGKD